MPNTDNEKKTVIKKPATASSSDVVTLINDEIAYKIFLPNAETDYIQKKIHVEKQPYELAMLQDIQARLKPNDLVLDIGANIGNHTLYLAAMSQCHIIAFEPNKDLADALLRSVELNDFAERITVHAFGVANKEARGCFAQEMPENLGGQSIVLGSGDISLRPLDQMAFDKTVKLIKIDVEGMELSVLQGAEILLRNDRPLIYVECQAVKDFQDIATWLDGLNYIYGETFNATPTHLFFPGEQIDLKQHVVRLQLSYMNTVYTSTSERETLHQQLDHANQKYRESQTQITALKQMLANTAVDHKTALQVERSNATQALQQQQSLLDDANQKYRDSQAQIVILKETLTDLAADHKAAMQTEQLRIDQTLQQQQSLLDEMNQKYDASQAQIITLRENLAQEIADHQSVLRDFEQLKNELLTASRVLQREQQAHQDRENKFVEELRQSDVANQHQKHLLNEANQKYQDVIRQQLPLLKQTITKLYAEVKKLKAERRKNLQKLTTIRASLTYQLGYQFKIGLTSVRGFIGLPTALGRIVWQAFKKRKAAQGNKAVLSSTKRFSVKRKKAPHYPKIKQRLASRDIMPIVQRKAEHKQSINVACIMDEFTYSSFAPECHLHQLTPAGWEHELDTFKPELLFIESAWRGKDALWANKIGHNSAELKGIIQWCHTHAVPTLFWNKEDPVHFQTFLNTAKQFDYVFTTDIDCIHRYKAALGHERVYFLPFACQPAIHNPIELYERKNAISFAGAYYTRYPDRTRDLEDFLDVLPKVNTVDIYDRNYGKNDPNYQFPESYDRFIVGTLPFDKIDQAYKGYQYAINLNSIKQSQTMFARRIYELLASNTITISNFSRGVRLLMGDLVVMSDKGKQIVQRLQTMQNNSDSENKLKLAALRKVMQEHTYHQRLNYIRAKVTGSTAPQDTLPGIAMLASVANQTEAERCIEQFKAQTHQHKCLVLLLPTAMTLADSKQIITLTKPQAKSTLIRDVIMDCSWIAAMESADYYGPNYLLDIAIATGYSRADLIGKALHFQANDGVITMQKTKVIPYSPINALPARQAAIKVSDNILSEPLISWLDALPNRQFKSAHGLAIDPYNYCRNRQAAELNAIKMCVDDIPGLDVGLSIHFLQSLAENIQPAEAREQEKMLVPSQLAASINHYNSVNIDVEATDAALSLTSSLADDKHEYIYFEQPMSIETLSNKDEFPCYLDTTPGLAVSLVILFLDEQKQRIGHVIFLANRNETAKICPETKWLHLGFRVFSSGSTDIKGLVLEHRDVQPIEVLGKAENLLLTNHYPAYHDLYRNGFVHSRVKAYAEKGTMVDVFCLHANDHLYFDEFENIDVITGNLQALDKMLSSGRYKSILVHFLDVHMWSVLSRYIDTIKVVVWVHGSEIQPFHRREYNYKTDQEKVMAKIASTERTAFWRSILQPMPKNLHLVFVSQYFADEVMTDLGIKLPTEQVEIIHNPINTEMFTYQEKPIEQRRKILSIRPYASAKYANDLSVKAIQLLAKKPWFNELEFKIIGDGALFDEILEPIKHLDNVVIERGFLTHEQIAQMHKSYGIFLCPTRMDAQGVSRDEAMSSGLVPVTNAVTAIPEFADDSCGILAPGEDAQAMADGIAELYENPEKFKLMSANAAKRVRRQSAVKKIVALELAQF